MKKQFLWLLLSLTAAVLCAGDIPFKNANFDIVFDTQGATIKKLIHNQVDWHAAGPKRQGNSFCDSRIGRAVEPKVQYNENFARLEYKLASWKTYKTSGWADVTFSVKGTVYNWLRLNKTYKLRTGNLLEVVYEFTNTSDRPQSFSFSPRWFFHRTDKENFYWQPTAKGIRKLKQQKSFFFVKTPPQTYIAIGADDNSGLLIELPADAVSGIMNWFINGRSSSSEFFTDEFILPAGSKRIFTIKLHFTKDLNKLIAQKKFTARPFKGKIPPMVDQLNQGEDRSYSIRTLKQEVPAKTNFFDVALKPQYKDSWRAVALPANIPLGKIAVFRLENGAPSFDRPVGYVLNGRELLLKVPGFHPNGSHWRASLKDGILFEKSGSRSASYGLHDFNCRIFYDRTDGVKLKEKAPAGGELIPNGTFDIADAKNPAIPQHHSFLLNKNYFAKYLKTGGSGNSPCLEGGELVFPMIPEAGMTYNVSFKYKNQGGGSMTRCYFSFYDAEGKRLNKRSVLMASSKKSFDWTKVTKKIYAPAEAAFMAVSVSRSSKQPGRVYLDDLSVKAAPLSCTKITPLEQGRKELTEMWGVPITSLESLSLAVENPHKKWFHPVEKAVDVLYLPFEHERGRMLRDKRIVVELAHRMKMNIKVIPVLRKIISSTGIYGVNVASFAKELSLYTSESLKALPKAPKVVLITKLNPKQYTKDLDAIFAAWQKQGTHFIVLSGSFPAKLRGKALGKAPVSPVLPIMKDLKRNRAFMWYKKGNSYLVECTGTGIGNPLVPVDMEEAAARHLLTYISRDYPWWEYQNLSKLQFIRFFAGVKPAVKLLAGNEKALKLNSTKAETVTVEVVISNMFREVKKSLKIKAALKASVNTVALPAVDLPGGTFVADVRILNAKGNVLDAGAFRIDRAAAVKAQLTLKNANGIFPQGKDLVFDLKLTGAPASSVIEAEVEDTFQRIIARKTFPAKASQTLSLELPMPRTIINNLIFRVKNNGRVLAEGIKEFSSPAGPTDFKEFFGMTWGFQRYLARQLELDGVTANSPYSINVQKLYRSARYENMAASPMGLASRRSSEYRGDRKTDPVRSPCFHDPAYLAKNKELLDKNYSKNNLLGYYDIRDYWSGDEQFLGSTVCYSPHCLKVFREGLKKEYKTIAALNKEWNTSFASFDKVVPQQLDELKSRENLSPWLDHKMFMAATFAWGQFRSHLNDLYKYNPHARMGASGTQKPGYSYDWAQYMKHCRVMSYYSGIQIKLIHDIGGKDILAGRWMAYCYPETDQETYCVSPMWVGLLRGSNMAAIWPPTMTNGDGTATQNVRFLKPTMNELRQGITKQWLSATAKPQIALLYSQSSLYTAMGTFGDSEWQNSQSSWLKLLDDMKYDCRYLSYEEVAEKGISSQYKLLILPAAVSISDKEAEQIEKFVKQGGTVIADYAPGRYDGHGKRRNSALLNKLFAPYNGPIDIAYQQLPQLGGRFKVAEKGVPFLQEKKYGKGRTILFNFSVSDYHFIQLGGAGGEMATAHSADAKLQLAMRRIVKKELDRSGIVPSMAVLDAKGKDLPCMALVREDGGTLTAALYKDPVLPRLRGVLPPAPNRIDRKKGYTVTVKLPFKGHVYDCRTGKYHGETDSFKTFLVPGIANFYSIQKKAVSGLLLQAPGSVKAGSNVPLTFTAAGAAGAQVFNVNVCTPDGKVQKLYRKNFRTEGNKGSYTFQIPFNAPKGKWQIRVAHVNTGIKKNIDLIVK